MKLLETYIYNNRLYGRYQCGCGRIKAYKISDVETGLIDRCKFCKAKLRYKRNDLLRLERSWK